MKIFIPIFIFMFSLSFGQKGDKEQILTDVEKMVLATAKQDLDAVLDFSYPPLFEWASRESLKEEMSSLFDGTDGMRVEMAVIEKWEVEVFEIQDLDDKGGKYVFITHPASMRFIYDEDFSEEEKENLVNVFAAQGNDANFVNDNTVQLDMTSMLIGVKDETTGYRWKYLTFGESDLFLLSLILPDEVMEEAIDFGKTIR